MWRVNYICFLKLMISTWIISYQDKMFECLTALIFTSWSFDVFILYFQNKRTNVVAPSAVEETKHPYLRGSHDVNEAVNELWHHRDHITSIKPVRSHDSNKKNMNSNRKLLKRGHVAPRELIQLISFIKTRRDDALVRIKLETFN